MNIRVIVLFVALATLYALVYGPEAEAADITLPVQDGWSLREPPKRFDADNLYTIIDGEAEIFLPYGLEYALFADYVQTTPSSPVLSVESYKMGSALDGFGIYSQSRSKNAKPVDIGVPAVLSSTQLLFWKGAYFGRITISQKSDASTHALEQCARALAKAIPTDMASIPEIEWLRIKGVVAGTEQYFAKDLLDLAFLKRGLTADVKRCGEIVRVFIAPVDSEEQAASAYVEFEAYLTRRDAKPVRKDTAAGTVLLTKDPDLKGVAVVRKGSFIVGVCQLSDPAEGLSLIEEVLAGLSAPTASKPES